MQYKKEILYKELSNRTGLDKEYIKTYVNTVMDSIRDWSANPTNLILNVKHFGKFYWKRKSLKQDMESKSAFIEDQFKRADEHKKFIKNAEFILGLYESYDEKKEQVHKLKYGEEYDPSKRLINGNN